MPRRQPLIPALVVLLCLASPYGLPEASAESWGPVVGGGSYYDEDTGQLTHFSTGDGWLSIDYDPSNPGANRIDFSTGSPGYGADANQLFTISNGGTTFSEIFLVGGMITVSFDGNPGPLNAQGDPLSLDSLIDSGGSVVVTPSYHYDLSFDGQFSAVQAVPEPSSLLTYTLGVVVVLLASIVRRTKKRRGPRGLAVRS